MTTVEPDKWYFHVICQSCERGVAFSEDPSRGTEQYVATEAATIRCPHCCHEAVYQPAEFRTGPGHRLH